MCACVALADRNTQFPPVPCSCDQDVIFLGSNIDSFINVATASFVQDFVQKRPQGTGVPDAHRRLAATAKTVSQREKKKKKKVQPDFRRLSKYPAAARFVPNNLPRLR